MPKGFVLKYDEHCFLRRAIADTLELTSHAQKAMLFPTMDAALWFRECYLTAPLPDVVALASV